MVVPARAVDRAGAGLFVDDAAVHLRHVEQQVCLLIGQGVNGRDEAVPEAFEAVLEGAAEVFVDDPSLGEATLDEALG